MNTAIVETPQKLDRQAAVQNESTARLSAIVITKNESENIHECLASLHWVQEIVVVDAESQDNTVALAREFTDKVFVRPWEGYVAAKQFALAQCTGDWVLWIDADERVTPELRQEICDLLTNAPAYAGYELARLANFLGRWIMHGGWYPGYVLRLFRQENANFNNLKVHEGVELKGKIGRLQNHLLHYTDRDIRRYFEKFNRYTSLAAEELHRKGKRWQWRDLLFRPPWMFLRMYVFKTGFLDGMPGFILACFSAAYVFTKYAKLWEIEKTQKNSHSPSLAE